MQRSTPAAVWNRQAWGVGGRSLSIPLAHDPALPPPDQHYLPRAARTYCFRLLAIAVKVIVTESRIMFLRRGFLQLIPIWNHTILDRGGRLSTGRTAYNEQPSRGV